MRLTPLLPKHAVALRSFVEDFHTNGEASIPAFFQRSNWTHGETVEHFDAWARGEPAGWKNEDVGRFVPCTTTYLEDEASGQLIGLFNFRHRLHEGLERFGGHVGYSVRPSARRRRHGVRLLRAALEFGAGMDLERLVVTCASTNLGSVKVIERCGGVLRDRYFYEELGTDVNRYWVPVVALPAQGGG